MKTKKVEIELPDIDGYEFVGYRELNFPEDRELYVYMEFANSEFEIDQVKCLNVNLGQRYFLYRKKEPRKIIFEETGIRKLVRGDYYCDIFGNISEWKLPNESTYKYTVLKKIHDDFEGVNND